MAHGVTKATFVATSLGVAGDPPALHWRKLGGSGTEGRALGGAVYITDPEVLSQAKSIPERTEVKITVVTDRSQPHRPSHLETIQALTTEHLVREKAGAVCG